MNRRTILAYASMLLLAACTQAPQVSDNHDADVKGLKDLEATWNQDFAAKDVDKIAAYFADDATVMGPGQPAASGKDGIRTMLKGMVSDPAFALKFTPSRVEVAKGGDIAFTQGSYTMTMSDPNKYPMTDKGSYVTVYKKQADGSWKAVSDIASSEVLAMPPQPAK